MKERPILFSGEMVRAILSGSKTQTRRVIKKQYPEILLCRPELNMEYGFYGVSDEWAWIQCPYGQPGDRLWVRETFYCDHYLFPQWKENFSKHEDMRELLYYRATDCAANGECYTGFSGETMDCPWSPSIHMPRWASRITLEITGVRVERLQDITANDALAEGTPDPRTIENGWDMKRCFQELWQSINGAESWASNPWVWVIEFKRVA